MRTATTTQDKGRKRRNALQVMESYDAGRPAANREATVEPANCTTGHAPERRRLPVEFSFANEAVGWKIAR